MRLGRKYKKTGFGKVQKVKAEEKETLQQESAGGTAGGDMSVNRMAEGRLGGDEGQRYAEECAVCSGELVPAAPEKTGEDSGSDAEIK